MRLEKGKDRPDIAAATRGGDWAHPMDGEGPPAGATRKEAAYWLRVYTEILAMEEKVLARIKQLMATQSAAARREVELTNVPVVVAQVERFRQRRGYWAARASELDGAGPIKDQRSLNLKDKGQVTKKT
ncbi:MAG TPA: hypothetical protein VLK30_01790 [Candidatus Limnocylindrales bacterium]|nr:hypothetical protein [Candidatus Limnocylindrales bacterium]